MLDSIGLEIAGSSPPGEFQESRSAVLACMGLICLRCWAQGRVGAGVEVHRYTEIGAPQSGLALTRTRLLATPQTRHRKQTRHHKQKITNNANIIANKTK